VGDYVSVVVGLLFWLGMVFETPLIIYLLARLGVVTPRWLAHYRRHAIVLAFVIAAVITPTIDPINQTLVAGPIIVLYEVGILLARVAVRARRKSSES
jgi:sec-independent protein translocase protein TatC